MTDEELLQEIADKSQGWRLRALNIGEEQLAASLEKVLEEARAVMARRNIKPRSPPEGGKVVPLK